MIQCEYHIVGNNFTPDIPVIIRMPGFSQLMKTKEVWDSYSFIGQLENKCFVKVFPGVVSHMKMFLRVYSSGNWRGDHLAMYLYASEGDTEFGQPPENEFNIKLLSHTNSTTHHTVTIGRYAGFLKQGLLTWKIESSPVCYGGTTKFLNLNKLKQESLFLSDDCLYFQVTQHENNKLVYQN